MAQKQLIRSVRGSHARQYLGYAPSEKDQKPKHSDVGLDALPPYEFYKDAVFVCLDYEGVCGEKDVTSEIGLSFLDVRDLYQRLKPQGSAASGKDFSPHDATPAGDRGKNWFRFIRTMHWRNQDHKHYATCPKHYHKGDPGAFAFGSTKFIREAEIEALMNGWITNIGKRNLRPGEEKRNIILLSFASHMEETSTRRHVGREHDWFRAYDAWDIQKMGFAALLASAHFNDSDTSKKIGNPDACRWLGVNTGTNLLHNAGNDSAFEMQAFLAGQLLTDTQKDTIKNGTHLPALPSTWNQHAANTNRSRPYPA